MNSQKWIPVEEKFPDSICSAYFICGHEWFGIGIWENTKGWTRGFIGEWPHGDMGNLFDDEPPSSNRPFIDYFLNQEVMYWREIIKYPIHGRKMIDVKNLPIC